AERLDSDGHCAGRRSNRARGRPPKHRRAFPHAPRGQGGGHRQRRGGQGSSDRNGDENPCAANETGACRRRRRARIGHLPLLARAHAGADGRSRGAGGGAKQEVRSESESSHDMIASIRGEVLDVALDHTVIEAAGVGYRVNATPSTLATLRRGSEARLVTAMIVREDSMTLYGFADADSRDLFQTLLSVSGVGPRLAMATLAVHEGPALRQVLADGDVTALTRVPGIGKRSAERMVLELRDKVGAVYATA